MIVQEHVTTVNTITIVLNVNVDCNVFHNFMQKIHFSAPEMIFCFKFKVISGLECSQKLNYKPQHLHAIYFVKQKNLCNTMSTTIIIVEK